ncbi:hypothetical protein VNO78_33757 [Psophocarpus tetragonolobus]|uniref:Uncharacterized protein n=1 Tax=Psophocarpus tetragonolobus TaxID=3891 RepID=A0AAN9NY13_PSOTE
MREERGPRADWTVQCMSGLRGERPTVGDGTWKRGANPAVGDGSWFTLGCDVNLSNLAGERFILGWTEEAQSPEVSKVSWTL